MWAWVARAKLGLHALCLRHEQIQQLGIGAGLENPPAAELGRHALHHLFGLDANALHGFPVNELGLVAQLGRLGRKCFCACAQVVGFDSAFLALCFEAQRGGLGGLGLGLGTHDHFLRVEICRCLRHGVLQTVGPRGPVGYRAPPSVSSAGRCWMAGARIAGARGVGPARNSSRLA